MKRIAVILVVIFVFTVLASECVLADEAMISTLNSKYNMALIKQRAAKGGSTGGASHYEYITDEDVEPGSTSIGNLDIGRGSSARRVFLVVDLKKRHHFKKEGDAPLRIGNVNCQSRRLRNATVIVNVAQPIRY